MLDFSCDFWSFQATFKQSYIYRPIILVKLLKSVVYEILRCSWSHICIWTRFITNFAVAMKIKKEKFISVLFPSHVGNVRKFVSPANRDIAWLLFSYRRWCCCCHVSPESSTTSYRCSTKRKKMLFVSPASVSILLWHQTMSSDVFSLCRYEETSEYSMSLSYFCFLIVTLSISLVNTEA